MRVDAKGVSPEIPQRRGGVRESKEFVNVMAAVACHSVAGDFSEVCVDGNRPWSRQCKGNTVQSHDCSNKKGVHLRMRMKRVAEDLFSSDKISLPF